MNDISEDLIKSWLKHIMSCKIVQTNWKVSPSWNIMHTDDLESIKRKCDDALQRKMKWGGSVFKKSSLMQAISQGECDVIGIAQDATGVRITAVDVAFHSGGLNYGDKSKTAMKVAEKCIRTAMCIYGYLDRKYADIIFATIKVNPSIENEIRKAVDTIQKTIDSMDLNFGFKFQFISNDDFKAKIYDPVANMSSSVADTSETFLRAYQLTDIYSSNNKNLQRLPQKSLSSK